MSRIHFYPSQIVYNSLLLSDSQAVLSSVAENPDSPVQQKKYTKKEATSKKQSMEDKKKNITEAEHEIME